MSNCYAKAESFLNPKYCDYQKVDGDNRQYSRALDKTKIIAIRRNQLNVSAKKQTYSSTVIKWFAFGFTLFLVSSIGVALSLITEVSNGLSISAVTSSVGAIIVAITLLHGHELGKKHG